MRQATRVKRVDSARKTLGRIHDALRRDAGQDGVVSSRRLYTATLDALSVLGDFCPDCRGSGSSHGGECAACGGTRRRTA